jgi:hypothetical protein
MFGAPDEPGHHLSLEEVPYRGGLPTNLAIVALTLNIWPTESPGRLLYKIPLSRKQRVNLYTREDWLYHFTFFHGSHSMVCGETLPKEESLAFQGETVAPLIGMTKPCLVRWPHSISYDYPLLSAMMDGAWGTGMIARCCLPALASLR